MQLTYFDNNYYRLILQIKHIVYSRKKYVQLFATWMLHKSKIIA